MLVMVALVGGLAVVGLAVLVGVLESRSLRTAWVRVAAARRGIDDQIRELNERELAMDLREELLARRERRLDYRENFQLAHEEAFAQLEALDPEQPV